MARNIELGSLSHYIPSFYMHTNFIVIVNSNTILIKMLGHIPCKLIQDDQNTLLIMFILYKYTFWLSNICISNFHISYMHTLFVLKLYNE